MIGAPRVEHSRSRRGFEIQVSQPEGNVCIMKSAEDHPLEAVPQQARQSAFSLGVVLFGFTFFSATMVAGGRIGHSLGLTHELLWAVLFGNLLLAVYAASLAIVAFESGMSTVLMARSCFGEKGSRLADVLLGMTQIGWYAWGVDTMASILLKVFSWPTVWYYPLALFIGIGFCITAAIGYKGLELLSMLMLPLMTGLILWSTWIALSATDVLVSSGDGQMTFTGALTIVVGTFVSGATQSTNWTRYAPSKRAAWTVTFLAFFLGNGIMVGYGALSGAVYNEADVVSVLFLQGFFVSALLMLLANIWTTQDNTIYNFSLAGCHFFRTEKRRLVTVVGALFGTALALVGFAQLLVPFLLTLGTAIPPLGGVLLADFFWVRRGGSVKNPEEKEPSYRARGLLSYFLAVCAAWFLPGVPPVTGVVVAMVVYSLWSEKE